MTFTGKVALVTGGTSGIGRETAVQLARAGAKIVLGGRRVEQGEAVVAEIQTGGGDGHFVPVDVAREDQVQRLVDETLQRHGRLDIAFNNAGVEHTAPLTELSADDYRRVFEINVLGVLLGLKHEIPAMLQSGGGAIVNTSSVAGHVGIPSSAVYVASKHAVEGITKTAAMEYAKQGIRVNAVAPGAIATQMIDRFAGEEGSEGREQMASLHPQGRIGLPQEVAAAVLYLASDAAAFTTGVSLPVDGGFLAR